MRTGHCFFVALVIVFAIGCDSGNRGDGNVAASSALPTDSIAVSGAQMKSQLRSEISLPTPGAAKGAFKRNPEFMSRNIQTVSNPSSPAPSPILPLIVTQRAMVRKAELAMRVKSIEPAEHEIEKLVANEQGYVDSAASTDLASDNPQITVTLRVPANKFESTITTIEAMGVRLSKTINSADVTGQLVDLDARLKSLSAEENTYQTMLSEAHSMDMVMQFRDKLTELRSQIESINGQRKAMGELASLSTLSVTLTQSAVPVAASRDTSWLGETWAQASTSAALATRTVVTAGIWIIALCPFWIPGLLILRRIVLKARSQFATLHSPGSTIQ